MGGELINSMMLFGLRQQFKNAETGVSVMAQQVKNSTIHENVGSIPGLTQWVKDWGVASSCGVGHRCGSDPMLPWLWSRLVAAAPIQSLAWGTSVSHRCS